MNLQCCTLFLKTESFKYILSKYWLSTIVFPESWPVLIHSSSLLIKGSVFWKYSILEVDWCISVSDYLVYNRRPKMNFLGKLLMQEIVIIIHFSWHFHGKTNCWYKCALWCNNSLLVFTFYFFAENELLFRDSAGGLSILDLENNNYTQIVSNTTFVSDTTG